MSLKPLFCDALHDFRLESNIVFCTVTIVVHTMANSFIWAPAYWGLGEIYGLLVPPGKASNLLSDHMITG